MMFFVMVGWWRFLWCLWFLGKVFVVVFYGCLLMIIMVVYGRLVSVIGVGIYGCSCGGWCGSLRLTVDDN